MARIVVIGAGLLGASSAVELLRRGHAVTLLERAVPGAEASSAAGGILSPQAECDEDGPLLALCLAALAPTAALVDEIRTETGIDAHLVQNGNTLVAVTAEDEALLRARVAWQRARGLRVQWQRDGREALFPDEGRLEPVPYTAGALALARARGAVVVSDALVDEIVEIVIDGSDARRVRGVRVLEGPDKTPRLLEADVVLVAAGAWSAHVRGAQVAADVIFPVRGQMVELQGPIGLLERVVFFGRAYAIPRPDGKLVLGSTMEHAGFDKSTTDEGVARVRAAAERALPQLVGLPFVRAWAGLRPASKDGLPLLGATAVAGLFVNTGHFRNGILLAALSAQLVGALVDGEKPPVDVRAVSPRRFEIG